MINARLVSFLLLFAFLFSGSAMLAVEVAAQPSDDVQLSVLGLVQPKRVAVLNLVSAELITVESSSSSTRRAGSSANQVYQVIRWLDARSDAIQSAAQKGVVFNKAQVKYDGVDGEIVEDLGRVFFTNYSRSAASGEAATETFHVVFEGDSSSGG